VSAETPSELILEAYLSGHRVAFDRLSEGTRKAADYVVGVGAEAVVIEVKEFNPAYVGAGHDPRSQILDKIRSARRKFRDHRDRPCCLILYAARLSLRPSLVLPALFGNHFRMFAPDTYLVTGSAELRVNANTTISAVVALVHLRRSNSPQRLAPEIDHDHLQRAGAQSAPSVRAVVYENPFARNPLSRKLFSGPYDERWTRNREDNCFRLGFIGARVGQLRQRY
jgi:hypothetical protein